MPPLPDKTQATLSFTLASQILCLPWVSCKTLWPFANFPGKEVNANMAFTENTLKLAWKRANGKCECKRSICGHGYRCSKQLVWSNRGNDSARGGWEAHHIVSVRAGGSDALSNCQILCTECHKNTKSYGHH